MNLSKCLLGGLLSVASVGALQAVEADRFALRTIDLSAQSNDNDGRFSVRATSSLRPTPDEQARFQLKAALVDCALGDAIFANGIEGNGP